MFSQITSPRINIKDIIHYCIRLIISWFFISETPENIKHVDLESQVHDIENQVHENQVHEKPTGLIKIRGDGNCYFYSIILWLDIMREKTNFKCASSDELRKLIYFHIKLDPYGNYCDYKELMNDDINGLLNDKCQAEGDFISPAVARLFKVNIHIHNSNCNLISKYDFGYDHTIYLCYSGGYYIGDIYVQGHYDLQYGNVNTSNYKAEQITEYFTSIGATSNVLMMGYGKII